MGLTISVDISEDDYLRLNLHAWNARFTATTLVDSSLWELGKFASCITGFPARPGDERSFVFGTRDPAHSGGYCSLHFRTTDSAGHAVVDISLEDEKHPASPAKAKAEFSIPVEAADIDRFVLALRDVQKTEMGEAGW